jgi:uncharacterized protein (DUF983 family)
VKIIKSAAFFVAIYVLANVLMYALQAQYKEFMDLWLVMLIQIPLLLLVGLFTAKFYEELR